ncbi:anion-transporting ArsA/GET3 family ATPase [Saccharopolyspora erythraea NRRL 2338]|uniref:ArsA-related P-loop ATPase n=2 Tax=Saccharopolyspora erythraea TaxID=1836 RepID=A0ABP3ND25_SACER|nr:ArsA-related P-loop ATPase [Saccharopolyspora erythraea]EQD85416.1 ATPase [Saccharopolyspora erythraea D]PFG93469.1 anion-transporting ArsA/GET3 family ATPase [Saccharopolyspora erythraea NRRL 2338]QRK90336.1 ArsA family ATPase [Saccharopolyspora erythraea]CAL99666.1 probable anion transporter ATPase [Saccharopolyspora erythraea NRRL 2338]
MTDWDGELNHARLHVVSGKGGTGKTTVAAALALALATGGRKVLLVEVEGRQGIAQLFDTAPLPYSEESIAAAPGGGELRALAIDAEPALLEYLSMFYNLGFAGRTLRKMGAIEFATTLAPGLRDVLFTGKIKECVGRTDERGRYVYDHVVVDAPPTGRVVKFLDVTRAMADLAKVGPIRGHSDGVVRLLHSSDTVVHLVTLLEDLPVRETLEAVAELDAADLRPGAVLFNRVRPGRLPARSATAAAAGRVDTGRLRGGLESAGLRADDELVGALAHQAVEHAIRAQEEQAAREQVSELDLPSVSLPDLIAGIDVAELYELAELLNDHGVGSPQ